MFFSKKSKASNITEKMKTFDYVGACDNAGQMGELYKNYQTYFSDFKKDFSQVLGVSNRIEGLVENIVKDSASVRDATEYIAQGATN